MGLAYVRGAEVVEVRDEEGKLMNDFTGEKSVVLWTVMCDVRCVLCFRRYYAVSKDYRCQAEYFKYEIIYYPRSIFIIFNLLLKCFIQVLIYYLVFVILCSSIS